MIRNLALCMLAAGLAAPATAQISASDFSATAAFREDFAGSLTGQWEINPDNTAAVIDVLTPSISTSGNAVIDATDGVLVMGNNSSTYSGNFGLQYYQCINSANDGSGDDFTNLDSCYILARIYVLAPGEVSANIAGANGRWQVGPYIHGESNVSGPLFRAAPFYNNDGTGGGPGAGWRGMNGPDGLFTNTGTIASSAWRLFSIMTLVDGDTETVDPVAVGFDANGDGTIDEGTTDEFNIVQRDQTDDPFGPFGIFTVGDVNIDNNPLLIDWIELRLPAGTSEKDWHLY